MVKPRYEETSAEVVEMLKKAHEVEKRIDAIKKAKLCPCGSGKPQASCCPDMKKGEHHKSISFSTEPSSSQFMIETGGQTYNAFYDTNQSLLDAQDVANKGATKTSVTLDGARVNPQDKGYEGHVTEG